MRRIRNSVLKGITNIKQRCQQCTDGVMVTDTEAGEMVCGKCGFVVYEHMKDSGPESRSFFGDDKTDRTRTGDGTSLARHDRGLATIINPANKDVIGKPLAAYMKGTMRRLRIWDRWSQTRSTDTNFTRAFNQLYRWKDKLSLSQTVIEEAAYIYRKAVDKRLISGRSISDMMAAALYVVCRDTGTTRSLKDILEVTNLKQKDVTRCYKLLVKEMDLKIPVLDPVQYIARIASNVGITEKTKRYAIEILRKAEENKISAGKNPMALAAAALYLACFKMGDEHSQKDISMAAHVSEATIRNRYQSLKKALKIEMKSTS